MPSRILLPNTAAVARYESPLVVGVQRAQISWATGATATATVQPVEMDNCVLNYLGTYNQTADNAQLIGRVQLTNATTLTGSRFDTGSIGSTTVGFCLTQYAPGVLRSVQRGVAAMTSGSTDVTITAVGDMTKTSVEFLGFSTSHAANVISYMDVTVQLISASTLRFITAAFVNQIVNWQVTEWN